MNKVRKAVVFGYAGACVLFALLGNRASAGIHEKTLSTVDTDALIEAANNADPAAVLELSRRYWGSSGDEKGVKFLKGYETTEIEKKALRGEPKAVLALSELYAFQPHARFTEVFKHIDVTLFQQRICERCDHDSCHALITIDAMHQLKLIGKTHAQELLRVLIPGYALKKSNTEGMKKLLRYCMLCSNMVQIRSLSKR